MKKYIKPEIEAIEMSLEQTILTVSPTPEDLEENDYEYGLDQL